MEQPTIWAWLQFSGSIALLCFGIFVLVADRVPALAGLSTVVRKASWKLFLIGVDRLGGFLLVVYGAIGRAAWGILVALWSGSQRDEEGETVNPSAATAATYVAGAEQGSHQNAPSAPSAVRPSVPSAADVAPRATVPPAVEKLMLDRSRSQVILALVAAGWSTDQIRAVIKGANATIGEEVEQARARLAAGEQQRATPIAERPTAAEFRNN